MASDPKRDLVSIEDRTFAFALSLVRTYKRHPPRDIADRVCWNQLLKSGTSAGANSAESGGAQSRPDWRVRRFIALKEMRETQFWLRLMRDAGSAPKADLNPLLDEASQLVAILTVIARKARSNQPGS